MNSSDSECARIADGINAGLLNHGTPVGIADVFIGATGLRHGWTVVTSTSRDFSRIEGLLIEDCSEKLGIRIYLGSLERLSAFLESFPVLCYAARDSLAPHAEAGWLHFFAHELDDIGLGKSGLFLDLIKGAAISPCHADDLVAILLVHYEIVGRFCRGASGFFL